MESYGSFNKNNSLNKNGCCALSIDFVGTCGFTISYTVYMGPRAFIGHFGALKQDFSQYWDNFLHFFSQNGPDLHLWPLNGPHC